MTEHKKVLISTQTLPNRNNHKKSKWQGLSHSKMDINFLMVAKNKSQTINKILQLAMSTATKNNRAADQGLTHLKAQQVKIESLNKRQKKKKTNNHKMI
jgi:siroheme synthase